MLELEAATTDDPEFVAAAGRLIAGAALAGGFKSVVVAHIDHWFGPRWLNFCGKLLGAVEVRNRNPTTRPAPPPFHPHRARSVREYHLTESRTFQYRGEVRSLHGYWSSEINTRLTLCAGSLYAWYSGDTAETGKGVVMVYAFHRRGNRAWYVAFDRADGWRLSQTAAVSPRRVRQLLLGV